MILWSTFFPEILFYFAGFFWTKLPCRSTRGWAWGSKVRARDNFFFFFFPEFFLFSYAWYVSLHCLYRRLYGNDACGKVSSKAFSICASLGVCALLVVDRIIVEVRSRRSAIRYLICHLSFGKHTLATYCLLCCTACGLEADGEAGG